MSPKISIILPCFNEKDNIFLLIHEIQAHLTTVAYEIIIVDDNSPDHTFEQIISKNLPHVKAFQRKTDPSLAKSINYGVSKAAGEYLVIMDSDFNHRPEDIPILIDNLKFFDCVCASRFVYGGDMGNRFRHLASWLFNIAVRIITRTMITDSLFGFFAIKKDIILQLPREQIFYGFGDYCIRLFYHLQKQQVSVLQIPGILGKRKYGTSNNNLFKNLFIYSKEVLKLRFAFIHKG